MRGKLVHFDILVEDISGKKALETLTPKIIGAEHTFRIIPYRGVGHIPRGLTRSQNVKNRMLLNNLPRMLRAYGKTYAGYEKSGYRAAVVVVCDLDDNCLKMFRRNLLSALDKCDTPPTTIFCIAIEELEAWYLGDIAAINSAYPRAKEAPLQSYHNDSICGTWEVLADAVYTGGAPTLQRQGYSEVGKVKFQWAEKITPYIDVESNKSPSFQYFRQKISNLATKNM